MLDGLGRSAPEGDLDGLVGAGPDAIALLARVLPFALVPLLDRLGCAAAEATP